MKRWTIRAILWGAIVAAAVDARAFERRYPPRYRLGSYSETIIRPRHGQPAPRQVYNGYTSRFPPPAFLYYGAPHGKDASGLGFNDALSPGF